MSDSLQTTQLRLWAQRIQAGDRSAPDELLRATAERLERLTHKMLNDFPSVRRWEQTGDVLQNATLRLLRALQQIEPTSVRDFFGLAAEQIRRELLDLIRHHYGPTRHAAHHDSPDPEQDPHDPPARDDTARLDRWRAIHEAVEQLPPDEREVVGLILYHEWTREQVADLLAVNERTVRRRWESALVRLHRALKDAPTG